MKIFLSIIGIICFIISTIMFPTFYLFGFYLIMIITPLVFIYLRKKKISNDKELTIEQDKIIELIRYDKPTEKVLETFSITKKLLNKEINKLKEYRRYNNGILLGNLFFYLSFGDGIKVSFGEKYIKGFSYTTEEYESGRYDLMETYYDFYTNSEFWDFIYFWYGNGLILISVIIMYFIYRKFNSSISLRKKYKEELVYLENWEE